MLAKSLSILILLFNKPESGKREPILNTMKEKN
jgi:hypothetical protein